MSHLLEKPHIFYGSWLCYLLTSWWILLLCVKWGSLACPSERLFYLFFAVQRLLLHTNSLFEGTRMLFRRQILASNDCLSQCGGQAGGNLLGLEHFLELSNSTCSLVTLLFKDTFYFPFECHLIYFRRSPWSLVWDLISVNGFFSHLFGMPVVELNPLRDHSGHQFSPQTLLPPARLLNPLQSVGIVKDENGAQEPLQQGVELHFWNILKATIVSQRPGISRTRFYPARFKRALSYL